MSNKKYRATRARVCDINMQNKMKQRNNKIYVEQNKEWDRPKNKSENKIDRNEVKIQKGKIVDNLFLCKESVGKLIESENVLIVSRLKLNQV